MAMVLRSGDLEDLPGKPSPLSKRADKDRLELGQASYRYYITFLFDGLETKADIVVWGRLLTLVDRLPLSRCCILILFSIEDLRSFKELHGIRGRRSPILFITEENPLHEKIGSSVLLELGALAEIDHIKQVLGVVLEEAHQENMIGQMKKDEFLRRIRGAVDAFGAHISTVLTAIGLG